MFLTCVDTNAVGASQFTGIRALFEMNTLLSATQTLIRLDDKRVRGCFLL